jgi:hypothetical protein
MPWGFWACLCLVLGGCAGSPPFESGVQAGTAKIKITPEEPVLMAGYGSRDHPSEGVAADLFARALAFHDGTGQAKVLVTADIIGFGPVLSRSIKEEAARRYGLTEENLLLVGSHTHNGPVLSERVLVDHPEQVKANDAYAEGLKKKILEIIGLALQDREAVRLEWARGRADFGMYRRVPKPDGTWSFGDNPQGKTDPEVPVLALRKPDGGLKALFFTYACHCTSIRSGKDRFYFIHPDWAICCSTLEKKMPGTQVMFVTGCGGDIDPGPKGPLSEAEKNGASMERALEEVLAKGGFQGVQGPIRTSFRRIELPLESIDPAAVEAMIQGGRPAEQKFARNLEKRLADGQLCGAPISYPVAAWRFGRGPTLVALAGEVCVEYALRLKKEVGSDKIWPIGYANEVMCYIPSERVLHENGYESGWSPKWGRGVAAFQMSGSGWDAPFAYGLEDRIIGTVHDLLKE